MPFLVVYLPGAAQRFRSKASAAQTAATSTTLQPMYFKGLKQSMRLGMGSHHCATTPGQSSKGCSDAVGLPAALKMDATSGTTCE